MYSKPAIRELTNTREVIEALDTLSRVCGYRIRVMVPGDPVEETFTLGKDLFEFDIYGYWKAKVALEPIASHNPSGQIQDIVALVRDVLTRAYEIDDLAEAVQESSDQIGNLEKIAMQQWLTIYMGMAAGAIAGAAWRRMEMEAETAAIKAREEIAKRVIHLMKNDLFAMKGSVNWIREIAEEKPFDLEALDSAVVDVEQDLHEASKIVSGFYKYIDTSQPELELVDINIQLMPIVAEMQKASNENLVFEEQCAPGLPEIRLDTALFKAIIKELIANAIQHLGEKGSIRIRTAIASEAERKRLNLPVDANFLAIEFADDGPGIADENKEKIFQMGFSTRPMGTGMGLVLVKKYVKQHQGKIAEVGKEGEGAAFLILLPIPEESK